MAGDLEKFLQQAAERLKQKLEQAHQPPPPPPPVRQAERARPIIQADIADQVIEAQVRELPRESGPNPLSMLDTRPGLAQEVGLADEKMAGHLHQVFDHSVSQMKQASSALGGNNATGGNANSIAQSSEVRVRAKQSSPMVEMLRNPQTLRAAFIASEIFSRKF